MDKQVASEGSQSQNTPEGVVDQDAQSPGSDSSTTPELPVEGRTPEAPGVDVSGTPGSAAQDGAGARRGRPFTSETARKARQVQADRERERNAIANEEARLGHLTSRQRIGLGMAKVSQADVDAVISALVTKAKQGDVPSIHAMARLLDQSFGRAGSEPTPDPRPTTEKPYAEWTEAERSQYRVALIEERDRLKAEERAAEDASDPRATVPDHDPLAPSTSPEPLQGEGEHE